jgi:hypothetical protein
MVTFTNAGRMGNWCFEAATAIAYALKHDLEFTVPKETSNPNGILYIACIWLIDNYNPPLRKNTIMGR